MESTPNGSGGQHWRATFADWQGAADRLGLKLQGGELKGPCPSCSGTDRFSVARSGVFQCRGCNPSSGNPEAVRAILGAAFPASRRGPERQPRTWPYATAGGQSVTVHRADGPDGKKVWRTPKGVKGLFLPLYHDQLAAGPLVIAEGETTADAIRAAGFDATTWQGGTA
ncbi:MAG: hypothetical protein OXS40_06280, partial [Gammaproteobacteria bacterium]|nr:hypothetical protein [Gammaproteobacteria bacterium]